MAVDVAVIAVVAPATNLLFWITSFLRSRLVVDGGYCPQLAALVLGGGNAARGGGGHFASDVIEWATTVERRETMRDEVIDSS